MKKLYFGILILISPVLLLSQKNSVELDSLLVLKNNQGEKINAAHETIKTAKKEIDLIEKELVATMMKTGHQIILNKNRYETLNVYDDINYNHNKLGVLELGDTVKIVGYRHIYYMIEFQDTICYVHFSEKNIGYPAVLFSKYKYQDIVNPYKKKQSSTSSSESKSKTTTKYRYSSPSRNSKSNSSRQCSGRTKKGSRCQRKTTSSTGRCYQH